MYKLKVKGIEYNQVAGTEDWGKVITRDFNDRTFRTKGDFLFTGWEEVFELVYGSTVNNGACLSLEGRVYFRESKSDQYVEWWRGEMKPQDFKFDLIKESLDGQILDNVWAAKFANSDSQSVFLRSSTSKNGLSISPCNSALCQFFDPTDSVLSNYLPDRRLCYRVFDIFTYLVEYQTDKLASFVSDYFDIGGEGEKYYITTGEEIRLHEESANPEISFSDLFDEMNKKLNLWIIIELDDLDNPIVRIEPQEYVFSDTPSVTVENPEGIEMQIDLEQLYTVVNVGSKAVDYDPTENANYVNLYFSSWNDESYNNRGDCLFSNNELDLVSTYIIDSNSIEQAINGDDSFDNDIFIIEIDPTSPAYEAIKFTDDITEAINAISYFYNSDLTNINVLANWKEAINGVINKGLSREYKAIVNTPPVTAWSTEIQNIYYENDSTPPAQDTDNIYTTISEDPTHKGEFKSQESGLYNFFGSAIISTGRPITLPFDLRLEIVVYEDDTLTTSIGVYRSPIEQAYGIYQISIVAQIELAVGNVAIVRARTPGYLLSKTLSSATMEVNKIFEYVVDGALRPLIYSYDIKRFYLPLEDFNTIEQNLGYVRFVDTKSNRKWDLWATEMNYNPVTQIGEGQFIGRPPITTLCWILDDGVWNDLCSWDDGELWSDPEGCWFVMSVDTTKAGVSANDEFQIPITGSGYQYIVDWGDGDISNNVTTQITHTYPSSGTYTVKIGGDFPRIYFNNGGDKLKLSAITQWGCNPWTSMESAFWGCANMVGSYSDAPDLSNATSMEKMFRGCEVFNSSMGAFNVSTITNMSDLFQGCYLFNNGGLSDINSWDTGSVTNMFRVFGDCFAFDQPLGNWDTSSVLDMSRMFQNGTNNVDQMIFDQNIGAWDVSSVTDMSNMFRGNVGGSYVVPHQFNNGGSADINTWDVSSVATFNGMFLVSIFNQPLGTWNLASCTDIGSMFYQCRSFDQDISLWNTSSVTKMSSTFYNARIFNQDIGGWDLSSCTDIRNMLDTALLFEQDIGAWDVSLVTIANNFLNSVTLTTANYNALLIGWTGWAGGVPTKTVQAGVPFSGGNSTFSLGTDAEDARTYLDITRTWVVTDGGGV